MSHCLRASVRPLVSARCKSPEASASAIRASHSSGERKFLSRNAVGRCERRVAVKAWVLRYPVTSRPTGSPASSTGAPREPRATPKKSVCRKKRAGGLMMDGTSLTRRAHRQGRWGGAPSPLRHKSSAKSLLAAAASPQPQHPKVL